MNVLHVIPSLSPKHGGPSFALPLLVRALSMQNVRTTVATTDDDGPGARRLDVTIGQIVRGEHGMNTIYFQKTSEFYKVSFGLRSWLRKHAAEFDLVHIHALFSFSSVAAARAARAVDVPYIVRPLGVLNRWGIDNRRRALKRLSLPRVERPILTQAAAVHYTSEAEKREAVEAVPELAGVNSAVIPLPIEVPNRLASAAEFFEEFPAAKGRQVILFLSRIDPKKGIELLLEAFEVIRNRLPEALLVIAGGGEEDYMRLLKVKSEQLRISEGVIWAGFLSDERKDAAWAAANVFVLPSYSENFGIAAAEALARGVPCVLSDQVALAEDARRAEAAMVVPCEAKELANGIERILRSDDIRDKLAVRSVDFVKSRYSLEAIGAQLVDLYHRTAKRPAP